MMRCISSIVRVEDADVDAVAAEDAEEAELQGVDQTDNHAEENIAIRMETAPTAVANVVLQVQPTRMRRRLQT